MPRAKAARAPQDLRSEDALAREFRVRLFNRKWIEGMMKEGYSGADQVSVMVTNAMGWEVVREGSVPREMWEEIDAVFVRDKLGLSIREWFESENPYAFQELSSTMLETIRKGYWKADAQTTRRLAEVYARSVVRHGDNGGLRSGGNIPLRQYVERTPVNSGVPDLASLKDRYHARFEGPAEPIATVASLGPAPGAGRPPSPAASPASSPPSASQEAAATTTPDAGQSAAPEAKAEPEAAKSEGPPTPPPPDLPNTAPEASSPVLGQRLEPAPAQERATPAFAPWGLTASALALFLGGFLWRRRVA
jgi:cobaltochelatase CobN